MKYSGSIIINKPRKIVVSYFADPKYLANYQEGFLKKEPVSGESGKTGAISKMYYNINGRDLELTEKITNNNLPESFEALYQHKHMDNTMKCSFEEIDANKTQYNYEFEYTRVSWLMPKLMIMLFPGMFRKMGEKWLNNFKEFVEEQK